MLLYQLTIGSNNSYANSIAVSNGNVYVCGSYSTNAVLWKNGTMTTLGQGFYTSSSNYVYYYGTAMQVVGSDVYVVGYTNNDTGYKTGRIWKNGTEQYWVANAVFNDIAVLDNDVYIIGNGKVWKNNVELYSESNLGSVSLIKTFGNDVYLSGKSNNNATVWKNGTVLYQLTAGTASDICVSNSDVYFLANNSVWKNSVKLYDIGTQTVNAISLPANSGTAIENIESKNMHIYPNPVKDELFIQSATEINKIEIYDITGKQMFTGNLTNGKSINIAKLPAGIYILKLDNYSEKFVKE